MNGKKWKNTESRTTADLCQMDSLSCFEQNRNSVKMFYNFNENKLVNNFLSSYDLYFLDFCFKSI